MGNGNHDRTRMAENPDEPSSKEDTNDECFLVAYPECRHPFFYLVHLLRDGGLAQTSASDDVYEKMNSNTSWQQRLSLFLMQTIGFLSTFMSILQWIVEFTGNTIIANGGLLTTLFRILCSAVYIFKKGETSYRLHS